MNVYWYLSEAKLTTLQSARPGFLAGVAAEIAFKLPFLEGKLSGAQPSTPVSELTRLLRRLRTETDIPEFDNVAQGQLPKMVWFSGPAGRLVDDRAFWMVMKGDRNALLLAGSAGYAIGNRPSASGHISPSADPVNAIRTAFGEEKVPETFPNLAGSLTYAWQAVAGANLLGQGVPSVEGLAFLARSVVPDRGQMSRVGCESLKQLLVGTPLYVRQL